MPTFFERVTGRNVTSPDDPNLFTNCIFCGISVEKDFRIVAENERFVVIKDKYPSATIHLLVIPRRHIPNTNNLTQDDVELVRSMHSFGREALDSVRTSEGKDERNHKTPDYLFGFHIPPFRSVDHLHLHCFQLPFLSKRQGLKYPVSEPSGSAKFKGTGWFVTAEQVIGILNSGQKIGFKSC
ncbi:hypothetical protein OC861_003430 [Tilletia horrida]|nr:hypothetical protein OC861_003430 [Tilletia horrida]